MRRAVIEVAAESLRDGLGPLFDAGLTVEGSLRTPTGRPGVVALVVQGDALPAPCEDGGPFVLRVILTAEAYGRQRLVRVTGFEFCGSGAEYFPPLDHAA